jgi:hypothetical protein
LVEKVGDLLTMQLGPNQVLLTVAIQFRRTSIFSNWNWRSTASRTASVKRNMIQRIFIEAESFKRSATPSSQVA